MPSLRDIARIVFLQVMLAQVEALVFLENPSALESGAVYRPPEGDFILACSTDEPANITWVAARSTRYMLGPGNGILNITQVTDRKSVLFVKHEDYTAIGFFGSYRKFFCRASNNVTGEVTTTGIFAVEQGKKPEFISQSEDVQVEEGQKSELKCSIETSLVPRPSVVWIFQNSSGEFRLRKTRDDLSKTSEEGRILKLEGLKREEGNYTCKATNRFGIAFSKPIRVTITYFYTDKFSFAIEPAIVKEGKKVTFSVHVSANPPVSSIAVIKLKNEMVVASTVNSNGLKYTVRANRNLTGNYNATAVHLSKSFAQTAHLVILRTPRGVHFKVLTVTNKFFNYNLTVEFEGSFPVDNVTMCCTVRSGAIRNVRCSKGISETASIEVANGTLNGLTPTAKYYCQLFATNAVGSSGSRTLIVKLTAAVPDIPVVTCGIRGESFITAEWTVGFNGGETIIEYNVNYREETSQTGRRCIPSKIVSNGGSCRLTNLKKRTQYVIEVGAKNSIGSSLPGRMNCNTTCFLESLSGLQVDQTNKTILKFNKTVSECGKVKRYLVRKCNETSLFLTSILQQSNVSVWIEIEGLVLRGDCITVTAITDAGLRRITVFKLPAIQLTQESGVPEFAIIVPCTAIPPLVVVMVVIVAICRKRKGRKKKKSDKVERGKGDSRGKPKHEATAKITKKKTSSSGNKRTAMYDSRTYVVFAQKSNAEQIELKKSRAYASPSSYLEL